MNRVLGGGRRGVRTVALGMVVASLLTAGCSGGSGSGPDPSPSASTPTVAPVLGPTPVPEITGDVRNGETLTGHAGAWGPGDVTLSYRWLRDGALDCLFSKEARELTPLAYQALSLRRRHRERRRQEHTVDSWEVFRSVVRACPYAIIVLDKARRVMLWSGGAAKVTGYEEEEMLGRELPGVSPKELDFLIHGLADHPFQEAELGWHRRDGAPYVARVRSAALEDTQGQAQGTVLIVADIVRPLHIT